MKSKNALKSACMFIGFATAWSIGGQFAHAGSVLEMTLQIDSASYSNVELGLVFGDHTEVVDLGTLATGTQEVSAQTATDFSSLSDIKGLIVAGVVPGDHVMVSSASPIADGTSWGTVFTTYAESAALSSPLLFTENVLANASDYSSVLGSDASSDASLYSFSGSQVGGSFRTFAVVAVPLPSQCLIGGALFAILALGKRSMKWLELRQEQCLA